MIAIPAVIIAGPLYAKNIENIKTNPTKVISIHEIPDEKLPGTANSFNFLSTPCDNDSDHYNSN
jgi:Gnt-I system high-affinity gluconate transporter